MTEELNLKNCPFCGESVSINKYPHHYAASHYKFSVTCDICVVELQSDYKEQAVEAWNSRV